MTVRDKKKARLSVPMARRMPDGGETKMHPLLWLCENRMPEGKTASDAARYIGVKPQTFYIMQRQAREDRSYPVSAEKARPIARFFGVAPHYLRPDLYDASWTEPKRRLV
jgi:hypothetical protein